MYTRHYLGTGCGCAETVFTACLTDAVMKGVKVQERLLLVGHVSSCTARVGVLVSQLFRAAGIQNRLFRPHFHCLYNSLAIIYQRGCMSGLVWVLPISVLPSKSLFGRVQLDLGFWLKM